MNNFKIKTHEKYESVILKLYEIAVEKLSEGNFNGALSDFHSCELILESNGADISPLVILSIYHNTSFCYQRLHNIEETMTYLTLSLQQSKRIISGNKVDIEMIQYKILRQLQLCASLSLSSQHQVALLTSKKSLKEIHKLFGVFSAAVMRKINSKKNSRPEEHEKQLKLAKLIEKVLLDQFDKNFVLQGQDWLNSYNMGNIMTIQPFDLYKWMKQAASKQILSVRSVVKSLCMLITCYFTIATELRITSKTKMDSELVQSKEIHEKALEICKCFLPAASPLYAHIMGSYKKNFGLKKKEDSRKNNLTPIRRIYMKRSSEKPRNSSEKNRTQVQPKLPITRKLTPSTRNLSNRAKANKSKNATKVLKSIPQLPEDHQQSQSILKVNLRLHTEKKQLSSSSSSLNSEPLNCNIYLAEEFRTNFIMTSKLLYGETSDTEDQEEPHQSPMKSLSRKELSKISLQNAPSKGFYS